MFEDFFFLRKNVVDVDAAVIGISKTRWVALIDADADLEGARSIMRDQQFDLLPIVTKDGIACGYFRTEVWNNYESVQRKAIQFEDVIPMQTPLPTVIKNLANNKRPFYFLTHQNRITGLVSFVHLNKRQVKIFLFSLISELETRLSNWLRSRMDDDKILEDLGKEDVRKRYAADKALGIESELMEYLYFSDLINLMAKNGIFTDLGYSNRKSFEKEFNPINVLRNEVAHPTKTLITTVESIEKLWNKIEFIERTLFSLRQEDAT